ncbi:MAG: hypothetical protein FJX75_10585 [Armatimonadetes bacterium]|nr:hypothetical protein [Armatimonadota bacterium]
MHELLAKGSLDARSHESLRELLQRIWNEQRGRAAGLPGLGDAFSAVLIGGRVQHGVAPLDVVETVAKTVTSLIRRMGAWCNQEDFAARPAPAVRDIGEAYRALMSEPIYGSYRIDLYLTQVQPSLDLGTPYRPSATPTQIIDSCLRFARLVGQSEDEAVRHEVPDERYRGTLIRLLRQLVPNGADVAEVEIRRPTEPKELAVRLRPAHREPMNSLIKALGPQPARKPGKQPPVLEGLLRAVDLDAGKLRVQRQEGHTDIRISDELHDTIGPMLNRRVVVYVTHGRRRQMPLAHDIDLARQHEPAAG